MPARIDDWLLPSRQPRLVKIGGRLIKHARYCRRCQWDEAETLTGADLVKKEIEMGNLRLSSRVGADLGRSRAAFQAIACHSMVPRPAQAC